MARFEKGDVPKCAVSLGGEILGRIYDPAEPISGLAGLIP